MQSETRSTTLRAVFVLALSRLFLNMTRRFAYPFIPEIARTLVISQKSIERAVAFQAGVGVFSPGFGPLSERFGRRRVMLGALTLMATACIPGMFITSYGLFFAAMLSFGLAKIIFDPAMQAYISDRVHYRERGFAIGVTELSWAGALIVAAPMTGFLLKQWGLSAVFAMLFAVSVSAVLLVTFFVPSDHGADDVLRRTITSRMIIDNVRKRPAALAAWLFSFVLTAANELMFIVYGAWMEKTFHLELVVLGTVTLVIGAAEVSGEFTVLGLADRLGKRRLALLGMLLASIGYGMLPFLDFSLTAALIGLFFIFISIEIAIVASITLFTEVLPEARAVMMSGNAATSAMGRFCGAMLGGLIYAAGNFEASGLAAMSLNLIGFGLLWYFIAEHH